MRIDRLTSKLQLALSDAQSLAVGMDHAAIEPQVSAQARHASAHLSIPPTCSQLSAHARQMCAQAWQ